MSDRPTILVVDREGDDTRTLIAALRQSDFEVILAADDVAARHRLEERPVEGLIAPLNAPAIDGLALLRHALERSSGLSAVMIGEPADGDSGVRALRMGAIDVQPRPLQPERTSIVLRRAIAQRNQIARLEDLRQELDQRFGLGSLVGLSPAMARVSEQIRHVASTRATVIIQGESGTGKNLIARAIHQASPRRDAPFVSLSLGVMHESLLVLELLGMESPTQGVASRRGLVELADTGTLFLDRIDEASLHAQVILLPVLCDREFTRAGSAKPRRVDLRIVAATNRDLQAEVQAGRFREDLWRQLSVVVIQVPPLRERKEDIPLLAEAFLRELNREHNRRVKGLTRGVLERMMAHPWPGNVRELRSTLEGMVVFAQGKRALDLSDLPPSWKSEEDAPSLRLAVGMTLDEAERQLLEATLRQTGFDKPRTASLLGIGLRTLYRKIQRYGIR